MATDIKSIYADAVRNTHAAENQGLTQMQQQLKGLENYPDYAALLRQHVHTTENQVKRLESVLTALGESPSAFKETVTNVAGAIGAAVHSWAQDETLKNLYAGYAYQYHQIAAYRSLAVFAEQAGHADHVAGYKQAVDEETKAAEAVAGMIESITKKYVALTLAGAKADS